MGTRPSLRHRLTHSADRLAAVQLQDEVVARDCRQVAQCRSGESVYVLGRLQVVVYTPGETLPTLVAVLFDGTDVLTLVWLGRRRIPGIEPGRKLLVRGRIGLHDGKRAIFNPWYELMGPAA